ncbi:hypothetical protein B7494_g4554 [Chlorociboria aeruginascens]|nr:hypothetical protein B7494_g4554 [Chlorociboria aeruginascens]
MMALTVDHLIPTIESTQVSITHISEQDRYDVLIPRLNFEARNLASQISHTCQFCSQLQLPGARDEEFDQFSRLVIDEDPIIESCSLSHTLRAIVLSNIDAQYKVRPLGWWHAQSGPRRRMEGAVPREMDWALFCVMFLESSERKHNNLGPKGENELHVSDAVSPGALIKSVGRTSGHQVGQISTTASRIFHGSYVTQEWCVINRPGTPVNEWIEGGIGVDGDSGGLIIDQDSNAVYGMLWGRTGDGPTTMTLFTPMSEILSDIRERTNSKVEFLQGQEMPKYNGMAEERISEASTVQRRGQTEWSHASETGAISYLDIAQSLERTPPYRRFERYRGDNAEKGSVPLSLQSSRDTNVNTQWPGTHTYLRYVLGDDSE